MRCILWAILSISIVTPTSADTIRAGGVGSATALIPALFAKFDRAGDTKLEVIPSLGSSGGLNALSEGAIDLVRDGL